MEQNPMKLPRGLRGRRGVVIDTMVFIHVFEDSVRYGELCEFIIDQACRGAFTGTVTPTSVTFDGQNLTKIINITLDKSIYFYF